MKIIVTVKHVPETGAVSLDEATGTMKREGVESIPNPLDLYAVEAALVLRERYGGTITALSMGPAGAERTLREVIAMGCDDAVLVTGREFAGSDTLATSRALARSVERLGGCDLLIFGERATDGDTGQVGPGTAALLDLPLAAYVSAIKGVDTAGSISVERLTEEGYEELGLAMPAALTVVKEVATPRLPTLRGKQRARACQIPRWAGSDLGLVAAQTGLSGSPTRVEHIFHPRISRDGELVVVKDEKGMEDAARRLAAFILSALPGLGGGETVTGGPMVDGADGAAPGVVGPRGQADRRVPREGVPEGGRAVAREAGTDEASDQAAAGPTRATTAASGGRADGHEVWVVAEDRGGHINPVSWELLGRARPLADKLGARLCVVVMIARADADETDELFHRGADLIYLAEGDVLASFVVETRRSLLVRLVRERHPLILLAAATTAGRALMPQVAVSLGTGLTADCTDLDVDAETGGLLQTRPAIGGNIMATIRTRNTTPNMATVRPHSAAPAPVNLGRSGELIRVELAASEIEQRVRRVALRPFEEESVALQDAPVIVSCGRGFRRKERIEAAEELAGLIGASIGASREVVDRGWLTYPHQIGLSGKTVSPELYVALGISGAVQHLAGIKTAKRIVAVNSDPDAPIFRVADFGVVADLFSLLPVLVETLKKRMNTHDA